MKPRSYHVYVITEQVPKFERTHEDVVRAALAGGADVIQFRDKTMQDGDFRSLANKLLRLCRAEEVSFIVNDRVEIAIEIGADGVHVGHEDMSVAELRCTRASLARPAKGGWAYTSEMIVGVSARNFEEAVAQEDCGADYLGVGPIFATGSKADASEPIGVSELKRICEAVKVPVVAIGGITSVNLPRIIESGAAGAAVISAVTHAIDMTQATQALQRWWKTHDAELPKRWMKSGE